MSQITYNIENAVAKVTLNRPEVHNAFNQDLIAELIECFDMIEKDPTIRVMILQSTGKSFSAGADLQWMKNMAGYSKTENEKDAKQLAIMLHKLYSLSKPTIARVQGSAFGGAIGLIACCDIAVASKLSKFCLSEVKLGLVPATISPYVIEAIGPRMAKRLFMTAEVISARRARRIGLINEFVSEADIDNEIDLIVSNILKNGPCAVAEAKQLVRYVAYKDIDSEMINSTSELIQKLRVSEEGQEGLNAFLEKRQANWILNDDK